MNVPKHTFRNKPPSMSMLGGRVLWGRIVFFGTTLFLVFLLGLLIGNAFNGGISQETHEKQLAAKEDEFQQEVTRLQGELKLANEKLSQAAAKEAEAAARDDGADSDESGPTSEETYETEKGDTLWDIAEQFYGDGNQWVLIAEANGLTKDSPITAGMTLTIPPKGGTEEDSTSGTTTTTEP